eukprot:13330283-Alexandrium_andersonii.AAC.1
MGSRGGAGASARHWGRRAPGTARPAAQSAPKHAGHSPPGETRASREKRPNASPGVARAPPAR